MQQWLPLLLVAGLLGLPAVSLGLTAAAAVAQAAAVDAAAGCSASCAHADTVPQGQRHAHDAMLMHDCKKVTCLSSADQL